jgi:hypothetical protein
MVEHEAVARAVHGLEAKLLALHVEQEHVVLVVGGVARGDPQVQVVHVGRHHLVVPAPPVFPADELLQPVVHARPVRQKETAPRTARTRRGAAEGRAAAPQLDAEDQCSRIRKGGKPGLLVSFGSVHDKPVWLTWIDFGILQVPEWVEEEELLLHAQQAVVPLLGLLQAVQVLLRQTRSQASTPPQ